MAVTEAGVELLEPRDVDAAEDDERREPETEELVAKSEPPTSRRSANNESARSKFLVWRRWATLRGLFELLGRCVGAYPGVFLCASFLVALTSLGMTRMVLKDRIRDGYTPNNAPSRYETDVIREFWNSSGDPMMTIVLLLAKDGGTMLRKEQLDEAERLIDFFNKNFTINYQDRNLTFSQICHPYCNLNKVFELFKAGFDQEYERISKGEKADEHTNITFPVAKINGFDVHLERSLFGVRLKKERQTNETIEEKIANMEHVEVILMLLRGDKANETMGEILALWENKAYDFSLEQYKSDVIELQVVGTEILDNEMIRDGQRMTPFFAAGFGFMITFVSISVLLSAVYYDAVDWGKTLIAVGATLCPILAVTSTYGTVALLGLRVNSFMLVMPFLIMGIGVDDAFLMMHSWQRLSRNGYTVAERMGLVYEQCGPSVTITSLTNFISFGIGALTPTPEIRLFCFATAMAMFLDYIFQLILFGPVLTLATHCEKQRGETAVTGWRKKCDQVLSCVLKFYCKAILNRFASLFVLTAVVVYWYFGIKGVLTIETRLDAVKILPKDSPIQKPNHILSDIVWAEYHPVTILVNNELNIANKTQVQRFWQMVDDFESLPLCKDYISYFYYGEPFDFIAYMFGQKQAVRTPINPLEANITYDKIIPFLDSQFYKHWQNFVKLQNTSHGVRVNRFWMTVAYENTSTWEARINLMTQWREVASHYTDFNVTVWEPNGMFVDQMLSLKSTGLLTLICMAVVCAIFIPNPCSVITASISIASICLGVVGFLSWWHFDLDPITMAAILMSIGMSVDFTAHVSYHYQLVNKKIIRDGNVVKIPMKGPLEKLEHTLDSVGWPMIQAGLSTIICILPLLFLRSYSPSVFVATIFLVVCWGIVHGLLVLPAFLGALPDCLTNANCYRTFLSTSSHRSCRYVAPQSEQESA